MDAVDKYIIGETLKKPKFKKLVDTLYNIVLNKESGKLEVHFSQGGVTSVEMKHKII